ncbi:PDZ domain-containing protein [Streptomyces sp. NPDC050095]|uniref:PDZ domain-containing protein n=1 Tax=unclassified Streptomyces TaxID=2593676 RepID=UPI00341B5E85
MEQTALRPKSMPGTPGHDPGPSGPAPRSARRPHAARRRGKRLVGWLFGLLCALVLVLAGIGLGTVGATVIGMSKLAEMQKQAAAHQPPAAAPPKSAAPGGSSSKAPSGSTPAAVPASLGVEVVDAPKGPGALVVAVHVPGPGYTAGLVRGDVLLKLGKETIGSAADLVAVVGDARPGHQLTMTVRHDSGREQELAVTPGVVT